MRNKKAEDTQEQTSQPQVDIIKQDCIINLELYHKLKGTKINLTTFSDNYKEEDVIAKLINTLKSLALEHTNLGHHLTDSNEAKMIEKEAVQLIIDYCVKENYLVARFPSKKKNLLEVDNEDDYGSQRFQFYVHTLINRKKDVSELSWSDVSSFWKAKFKPKEE